MKVYLKTTVFQIVAFSSACVVKQQKCWKWILWLVKVLEVCTPRPRPAKFSYWSRQLGLSKDRKWIAVRSQLLYYARKILWYIYPIEFYFPRSKYIVTAGDAPPWPSSTTNMNKMEIYIYFLPFLPPLRFAFPFPFPVPLIADVLALSFLMTSKSSPVLSDAPSSSISSSESSFTSDSAEEVGLRRS